MMQLMFKKSRKPFSMMMAIVLTIVMAPQITLPTNATQTAETSEVNLLEAFEESDIPTVNMADVRETSVNSAIPTTINASKYDPRDTNYSTSVKDQQNAGLCWDFALNAAAELSLIASGQATKTLDLSEYYVAGHIARLSSDYRSRANSGDYGLDAESVRDFIGEDFLPLSLESKFPYSRLSNGLNLTDAEDKNYDYEIDRVSYIADYTPNDETRKLIKQSIVDYGGVFAAVNGADVLSVSGSEIDYSSYCTKNFVNHAVTIVGWDDNYSASNFKTKPKGNGAWLVKNSYGYEWLDAGVYGSYHWMSYYQDNGSFDARMSFHVVKKGQSTKTYAHKDVELKKGSTLKVSDFWGAGSYVKDPTYSYITYKELTGYDYGTKEYKVYDKSGNKLGTMTVKCVGDVSSFQREGGINYSKEEDSIITMNLPYYTTFPTKVGTIGYSINGNMIKDIKVTLTPDNVISLNNRNGYIDVEVLKCGTADVIFTYQDAYETGGKECKEVLHFVITKDDPPTTTQAATTTRVPTTTQAITTTQAVTTQVTAQTTTTQTPTTEYKFSFDDFDVVFNRDEFIVGETSKITVNSKVQVPITYQSSDTNVATVDRNGVIHAVGCGTAIIYVMYENYMLGNTGISVFSNSSSEAETPNVPVYDYSADTVYDTGSQGSTTTVQPYEYYYENGITYEVPRNGKTARVYSVYKNKKTLKVAATIAGCKVTTISAKAFENCKANKIVLGKNITTINAKAFKNAKLKKLEIKSTKLKTVSKSAFQGVKKVTVKVPNKKFQKYKKLFKKISKKLKVTK